MAGARRIPDAVLAALLHRLSIATSAGIDLRRAWASEAGRVPGRDRLAMTRVATRLAAGDGLGEACAASGGSFPAGVTGMMLVGDRTGRLSEVLAETSKAITRSLAMRRRLRAGLVGPAIRLAVAVLAIITITFVGGVARGIDGAPLDILGLGLSGGRGVVNIVLVLAATIAVSAALVFVAGRSWRRQGWAWVVGRRMPIVGRAARMADAAAWCRAASLAAHAGMAIGDLVELASRASPGVACDRRRVEALLRGGRDLPEAISMACFLPAPVVEALAVGEATGSTAEVLDRVADQLDEESARRAAAAVQAAGFLAWGLVAALAALLAIRVASTYARMIHDLTRPR